LFWGRIRPRGRAQPIARRRDRMPRGECEFSATPLLVRASEEILESCMFWKEGNEHMHTFLQASKYP